MQQLSADDLCRLAGELAAEHGHEAGDYARRAVASLEAEGRTERAYFWFMMSVLLDDIALRRLDPGLPVTLH